jgi:hypothetical protein
MDTMRCKLNTKEKGDFLTGYKRDSLSRERSSTYLWKERLSSDDQPLQLSEKNNYLQPQIIDHQKKTKNKKNTHTPHIDIDSTW